MANENLIKAKKAKNDEFYTQYHDIEKEIAAYLESTVRYKSVVILTQMGHPAMRDVPFA